MLWKSYEPDGQETHRKVPENFTTKLLKLEKMYSHLFSSEWSPINWKWTKLSQFYYQEIKTINSICVNEIKFRITATIPLTSGEIWYKKLKETVENAQMQPVWMSETKVESVYIVFSIL